MKTVEEIKKQLKEYKESFKHRDMSNPLDRLVGGFDKIWIDALEWVLEDSEDENNI